MKNSLQDPPSSVTDSSAAEALPDDSHEQVHHTANAPAGATPDNEEDLRTPDINRAKVLPSRRCRKHQTGAGKRLNAGRQLEHGSPEALDRLGRFSIIRRPDGSSWEVGRDSLGITYKAFDPDLQAVLALKIVDFRFCDSNTAAQDLSRRAAAVTGLLHPNIARLFSYGQIDGRFFYATEYVEGETLDRRIEREGPLYPVLALQVIRQATRALVAANREGLVHGDLKPGNLMLASDKDQLIVKMLDFGYTRTLHGRSACSTLATPPLCFRSPEQLEGKEGDIRSDIYSLGAILWLMLIGRPPSPACAPDLSFQHERLMLPGDILGRVPPRVAALMEKLLATRPEDRFQDPIEIELELDHKLAALKDHAIVFPTFGENPTAARSTNGSRHQIGNRYKIITECPHDKEAFQAKNLLSNTVVALRPLPLPGNYDIHELNELRQEVSQIRELHHPNLAELIGVESGECGLFLVTEWINGFSLQELLQSRSHHLAWSETAQLADSLADVLDFVAARRLLPSQLSLRNVFVDLAITPKSWVEVKRSPVSCWPLFVLKLEAVCLGRILRTQFMPPTSLVQNRSSFRTASLRGKASPSAKASADSPEDMQEPLQHPVQQLSYLICQLLSGPPVGLDHAANAVNPEACPENTTWIPSSGLSDEGNTLLRLGLTQPCQFSTAKDFLARLRASQSSYSVSRSDVVRSSRTISSRMMSALPASSGLTGLYRIRRRSVAPATFSSLTTNSSEARSRGETLPSKALREAERERVQVGQRPDGEERASANRMKHSSNGISSNGQNGVAVARTRDDPPATPLPEPGRRGKNKHLFYWIALPLAILTAAGTSWFWIYSSQFETTDDAYITGHEHPISFRVAGTISEVLVEDNQFLNRGSPIARLDPKDYQVALAQTRAHYLGAKAQLQQATAHARLVEAQLAQAQAQADASKANRDYLERTFGRNSQLFDQGRGVISKQDLDTAESQAEASRATYKGALAAVNVARENLNVANAQEQAASAEVDAALAQVQDAELQLSYTTAYAPADGWISQKTFEVGKHVQPGQTGLSITEPGVWIVANFKENQLGRIRPGQSVEIHIDAISNHTFLGKVDSFQSGTGAVHALLPPDNATGNFTKIVQRVPVKIQFEPESIRAYEHLLVPGLSTEPKIRVTR
ncbi:MAG TPA: protein kinase [Chthoniobacterales bacterium]